MDLRELLRHLRATTNDSAVQRATGLNRRTIARYRQWASDQHLLVGPLPSVEELAACAAATLTRPAPPQTLSSLAPYRAFITERHYAGVDGTAIHERLKEQGFTRSLSCVYRFLRQLQPPPVDAVVRVETAPGEVAQVDFGYVGFMLDPDTQRRRKAWAFVMVLAWSRHTFVKFVWDQTIATWITLHRHAFTFFDGVPKRLVIDNLKAGITQAVWDDPQIQQTYRECAEHYGFLIDPCRPRTPEHKGKVESAVKYVKRNFMGGQPTMTLPEANAKVRTWCLTTAGQRRHGTTKEQPLTRYWQVEQALLQPLPTEPYDLANWKEATVHRDCYVVFDQAFYSVPFRLVGQRVRIRGGSQDVRIYTRDWQLAATHPRARQPGVRATHHDHLPPTKVPNLVLSREACVVQAQQIGPAASAVTTTLLADPVVDRLRTVGRILRLAEQFGSSRLEAACARALHFNDVAHRTIKQILERGLDRPPVSPVPTPPARQFVRSAMDLLGHLFGGDTWM